MNLSINPLEVVALTVSQNHLNVALSLTLEPSTDRDIDVITIRLKSRDCKLKRSTARLVLGRPQPPSWSNRTPKLAAEPAIRKVRNNRRRTEKHINLI